MKTGQYNAIVEAVWQGIEVGLRRVRESGEHVESRLSLCHVHSAVMNKLDQLPCFKIDEEKDGCCD